MIALDIKGVSALMGLRLGISLTKFPEQSHETEKVQFQSSPAYPDERG